MTGNSYSDSQLTVLLNSNATKEDLIKFKEYLDLYPSKAKNMQWEWDEISRLKLSDDFINIFSDYLSWSDISEYQDLSKEMIEKYENKLNWKYISANQNLSEEMIEKYANEVNWKYISANQNLSEDFIRKHKNDVDWSKISFYQKNLSIPFIEEFINYLDLDGILVNSNLSEEFIKKYADEIFKSHHSQRRLFMYQNISPELFKYFLKNKYPILISSVIAYIIQNQNNISKEFIEKYNKDIDWKDICNQFHKLKEPFMRKFHEYLDWDLVSKAQKLSEKFIEDFQNKVNWQNIFKFQESLSPKFREKWKHKINN